MYVCLRLGTCLRYVGFSLDVHWRNVVILHQVHLQLKEKIYPSCQVVTECWTKKTFTAVNQSIRLINQTDQNIYLQIQLILRGMNEPCVGVSGKQNKEIIQPEAVANCFNHWA